MSAAVLREAAALMRERAEAATRGPWFALPADDTFNPSVGTVVADGPECLTSAEWVAEAGPKHDGDATHIASWHPVVALAVADWLESEIVRAEFREDQQRETNESLVNPAVSPYPCYYDKQTEYAIETARAYLGTTK